MIAKMLGRKRQPTAEGLEKWMDYHIRICREVKAIVRATQIDIQALLNAKKNSFAGHVSRFSMEGKETHLVKMLVLWRCKSWWKLQQKQLDSGESSFTHPRPGRIARWEGQFPSDWVLKFSNETPNKGAS